ncbi:MAG: hypothetical protein HYZ25_17895 [Chloroflexi bacterium]|nr:hypothetical protein [Chloroflexota bacterium]
MNTNQRPSLINLIAAMTLVSGIVNVFWGMIASHSAISTVIGILCVPITILPAILGVVEIVYAARLFGGPTQPARPSTGIAALEIACILAGNAFSMVVGILALVFYNDLIIKRYFDEINGIPTPAPVPVQQTPSQPEADPAAPLRTRKVA